jgi:hypothetical protein
MSPRSPRLTAKQVIKQLKNSGFIEINQTGSHLKLFNNGTRNIQDNYYQYIFATDDKRCATIGKTLKVLAAIDYGNVIYNQTLISCDFPHWKQKDSFLLSIYQELFPKITERAIKRSKSSEKDNQFEIETIVSESTYQIAKIKKELEITTKKGFG